MRVVSMVPSWTETLIAAGVDVVGRTKFCIHPAARVADVPVVGGTKKINWDKLRALDADLLLLDKEENPREMAEQSPIAVYASHVRSIDDVAPELAALSGRLDARPTAPTALVDLAERWRRVCVRPAERSPRALHELPGVLEWVERPGPHVDRLVYLIWRDPWMAVGPRTFIGSMLARLGFGAAHVTQNEKYPVVDLGAFDAARTLLCFSSEPYPFARYPEVMRQPGFGGAALVDGEVFSWFGVRALEFLERSIGDA
ncbi:MAG: hypothetical protein KC503_46040 [Myxococcales bacterium]|nr:hypothetical protein [Myxococcales bacterium]